MSIKQRVKKLEEAQGGPGGFEIVGMGEFRWSEEQLRQAEAEARERVGPSGCVIAVKYVSDWRGARDAAGFHVPERGKPEGDQ
jgi:hypothetical protein